MTTLQAKDSRTSPAASIRATDLLAFGKPFIEFPQYSILDLRRLDSATRTSDSGSRVADTIHDDSPTNVSSDSFASFSDWLSKTLQAGQPFVIRDFEKLDEWDNTLFSIERLIELSTKKSMDYLWFTTCNTVLKHTPDSTVDIMSLCSKGAKVTRQRRT